MKSLYRVIFIGGALLSVVACGGSPTAPPPPVPALRLDPETGLTVARRETGQLRAWYGLPAAQTDVTAAAVWSSSNASVAGVRQGSVTALAPGVASISVEYEGQRQTTSVTVRRRMLMTGAVGLSDANGRQTLVEVLSFVDERNVGYAARSHAAVSMEVRWGRTLGFLQNPPIAPGSHEISVSVTGQVQPPNPYVSQATSRVVLIDFDTSEELQVIPLPVQRATLPPNGRLTWTVQAPVFPS